MFPRILLNDFWKRNLRTLFIIYFIKSIDLIFSHQISFFIFSVYCHSCKCLSHLLFFLITITFFFNILEHFTIDFYCFSYTLIIGMILIETHKIFDLLISTCISDFVYLFDVNHLMNFVYIKNWKNILLKNRFHS